MAGKTNNNLVTKTYLDRRLIIFGRQLKNELKQELREDLYTIKDEIVGEIKAMREEFDFHHVSHERKDEELHEHDQRIAKLETQAK